MGDDGQDVATETAPATKRRRRRRRARRPDGATAASGRPEGAPPSKNAAAAQPSRGAAQAGRRDELFGALDLGTNNCRLLIAAPTADGFRAVDAFSRIVRLGEGLSAGGALTPDAMDRAVDALKVCAVKLRRRSVRRVRCVATQACRAAANGSEFVERVRDETGIGLDVITAQEEARLSVVGCVSLIDQDSEAAMVVDIGGGSTELSWVDVSSLRVAQEQAARDGRRVLRPPILAWVSAPIGVVTLAERFPERADRRAWYEEMRAFAREHLPAPPGVAHLRAQFADGRGHLVGTSGAVTSLAGMHLRLPRYDRSKVDGLWVSLEEARAAARELRGMCQEERAAQPCIGPERADLVLAGCAILEAVTEAWPSRRLRVADRGLREGMLLSLMHAPRRRRRRGRARRRG